MPHGHVDLPDELGHHQEQRHQRSGREPAVQHQRHPGEGHPRQAGVQQQPRAPTDGRLDRDDLGEACVHAGGELDATPEDVRLAAARAQVVAGGDALLDHRGVVGPGPLLLDLEPHQGGQPSAHHRHRRDGGQGDEDERRPPGEPTDQPERHQGERRPHRRPRGAPERRADLVRVVVHPVQHFADGLLAQHRQRLAQRGSQQVATQPTLRTVHDAGPQHQPDHVEQGRTDDAPGEQHHQAGRRPLGQAAGHHRAQGHPHGTDARGHEGGRGGRTSEARQGDGRRRVRPTAVEPAPRRQRAGHPGHATGTRGRSSPG